VVLAMVVNVALAVLLAGPARATGDRQQPQGRVEQVVFVGNNWDGSATVLEPRRLRELGRIDVIPDRDQRMAEIATNPYRLAYFLAIRELIGEGHDQFVDDLYSNNSGTLLVASRPSFGDVVGISLATGEIVWRFPVAGVRADHMAMSPDGTRVAVSASTANLVHLLDVETGREVGSFPSGGSPHESIFFDHGRKILHASIGMVYSPLDDPALDATKDERVLQIVDARTLQVLRRFDVRAALDRRGMTEVSSAVRPLAMSPDTRHLYFQLSCFHGFVETSAARRGPAGGWRTAPSGPWPRPAAGRPSSRPRAGPGR